MTSLTSLPGYDRESVRVLYDSEPHGIYNEEWDAQEVRILDYPSSDTTDVARVL